MLELARECAIIQFECSATDLPNPFDTIRPMLVWKSHIFFRGVYAKSIVLTLFLRRIQFLPGANRRYVLIILSHFFNNRKIKFSFNKEFGRKSKWSKSSSRTWIIKVTFIFFYNVSKTSHKLKLKIETETEKTNKTELLGTTSNTWEFWLQELKFKLRLIIHVVTGPWLWVRWCKLNQAHAAAALFLVCSIIILKFQLLWNKQEKSAAGSCACSSLQHLGYES